MGPAFGAAEGLVPHLNAAGTVMGKPGVAGTIGRERQHHLENRAGAESSQRAVDEGGIVGRDARCNVVGIKLRHTDAGEQMAGPHLHDKDTPPRQAAGCDSLAGALDVGIEGKLHALRRARVLGADLRFGTGHQ